MNHALLIPRRRSGSDFVAQLLAYSPIALWSADRGVYSDAGTTLAVATDPVYQWNDQSGNGRHLTQATLASRPILTANYQNGLPGVVFDGVDDFMLSSAFQSFPSKRGLAIALYKNTEGTDYGIVGGTFDAAAISTLFYSPITGPNYTYYDNVTILESSLPDVQNTSTLKSWFRDGDTTLKHRRNGVASDSFTIANNQPSSGVFAVGATTSGVAPFMGGIMVLALFP